SSVLHRRIAWKRRRVDVAPDQIRRRGIIPFQLVAPEGLLLLEQRLQIAGTQMAQIKNLHKNDGGTEIIAPALTRICRYSLRESSRAAAQKEIAAKAQNAAASITTRGPPPTPSDA